MTGVVQSAPKRAASAVRRHGVGGTLQLLARTVRRLTDHRETYIWFELPLGGDRPRVSLADGFELHDATGSSMELFHRLATTTPARTRAYLAEGGRPYVVESGGAAAFACWIHPRRAPLRALPQRFLDLPDGVACLEDSVANPDFRGQGVAPRTWSMLATGLEAEGFTSLVTKVRDDNDASCRAVVKAGFEEVARMHVRQRGPLVRLRCESAGAGAGPALVDRLDGAGTWLRPSDVERAA